MGRFKNMAATVLVTLIEKMYVANHVSKDFEQHIKETLQSEFEMPNLYLDMVETCANVLYMQSEGCLHEEFWGSMLYLEKVLLGKYQLRGEFFDAIVSKLRLPEIPNMSPLQFLKGMLLSKVRGNFRDRFGECSEENKEILLQSVFPSEEIATSLRAEMSNFDDWDELDEFLLELSEDDRENDVRKWMHLVLEGMSPDDED